MEVEKCSICQGMWFQEKEVDSLEDSIFPEDAWKNSMITNVRDSDRKCPTCQAPMKVFKYRFEDLEVDYCINKHGFWLDKGEEERIKEVMKEYADDLDRRQKAEANLKNALTKMRTPGFFDQIKNLLGL